MKTQIIQVEMHDDVVSLCDKLSWVKARRVVFVYPRRGAMVDTRLAWLLLRRKAMAMGALLGLVAHTERTRRLAQEAGVLVFAGILEAQQAEWPTVPRCRVRRRGAPPDLEALRTELHRVEKTRLSRPGARLAFFSLAVLALLALLLFLWPAAEIRLSPAPLTQSLLFSVRVMPAGEQGASSGTLPLYLASVVVEGSRTWPAGGQVPVAVSYARGNVRFWNLTNTAIGIPAGTVVQTVDSPPVRFVTLQDAVVEAGVDRWVDVPARAESPGTLGNLPADSLKVIASPLGGGLKVTNPAPTYGGSEQLTRAPSREDRRQARDALLTELHHRALTLLQEEAKANSILLPDTLVVTKIVEELSLPAEGQPGDVLMLSLKAEFSIRYLTVEDLRPRVKAALDAILPAGFTPVTGTLSIVPIESTLEEDNTLTCRFLVSRTIARQVDEVRLARLVRGKNVADASVLLSTHFPRNAAPQIQIKPSWWPWLPFTEFRIEVGW